MQTDSWLFVHARRSSVGGDSLAGVYVALAKGTKGRVRLYLSGAAVSEHLLEPTPHSPHVRVLLDRITLQRLGTPEGGYETACVADSSTIADAILDQNCRVVWR